MSRHESVAACVAARGLDRCGSRSGGCHTVGCPAQREKREAALAALPKDVLDALEDGAVSSVFDLPGDLGDVPMGRVAAAALSGFLGDLTRGWKLVGPNGGEIRCFDLRMAVEGWSAKLLTDQKDEDDFG